MRNFENCATHEIAKEGYKYLETLPFDDQFRLRYYKKVSEDFRAQLNYVNTVSPVRVERFRLPLRQKGMYKIVEVDVQPRYKEIRATSSLTLIDVAQSGMIINGRGFTAGRTARSDGAKYLNRIEECFLEQ
jgi:hypothetical protein